MRALPPPDASRVAPSGSRGRRWWSQLAPLTWAVALACGSNTTPEGSVADPAHSPILVGEFGSLTGSEATFGQSTHNGITLAVEEINARGGVKGRPLEVKTYDDQGKTQEAGTAVTRLITEDHVVAVLGEVASSLSIAGGRVAQQYGVPMISPSSTNAAVTEIGDKIFRVCFIDAFQGYVGARFASENLSARKVAVLYDQSSAYSKGLKDDFSKAFTGMGGAITTEVAYEKGASDFSAQLTAIRDTAPEAIYLPGYYTDVGNIAIQARKLGMTMPLLGGDGWDSSKLAEIGGDAIEGAYYSNHYAPEETRPAVVTFVDAYQKRFGAVPDGLAALGYDAAHLLAQAMERSPDLTGPSLAAAIAATKDFPGVTGAITIDPQRNASKPAVMVQMKSGRPTWVATISPPDVVRLLQTTLDALAVGSTYALIALGYTMVYGILRFINFAHSDIFMLGAWISFTLASALGWGVAGGQLPPWWGGPLVLLLAMASTAAIGFTIERLAYRPLRQAPRINVLIAAIGISLLIENAGQLPFLFGTQPQRMPPLLPDTVLLDLGGVSLRLVDALVVTIALALMGALEWLIYGTRLGLAMRAVAFDHRTAALMGIDVDRVVSSTFAVGSALAAAAGFLYASKYPGLNQPAHSTWILLGLKAFVAAVVGGIGNLRGAMAGGLLIGMVELFGAAYLSPHLRDVYVFSLLIVVLLVRPAGLLGRATVDKV